MKRKYLMKSVAAMLLGVAVTGCVNDPGYTETDRSAEYKKNAETKLGITIPDNQDFTTVSTATVAATVNMEAGETYTVHVFSNDPIQEGVGKYIASGTVQNGSTFTSTVTYPSAKTALYIGLTDSKNFTVYKKADIEDGQVNTTISTKNTAAAARGTRSITDIPGDPFTRESTEGYYKTTVPSTAKTIDDYRRADWGGALDENALQGGTEFVFANGTFGMHCWMGHRDIYISGNVTFNVDGTNSLNQARIYVLPHATLNFNMSHFINDLEIYVAEYGTLNYNAEQLYKQTGGGKIYNKGTMNLLKSNFEVNQDAIVYNEGILTGTNITSKPGDGHPSFLYNFGEMTLEGKFELNSCANFFNEGYVTVKGETSVTQQKIWWINKGSYTTKSMKFSAKNTTFYNYCRLLVNENAHMYDGEFNLMPTGYIEAATAEFDNFIVNMGDKSGFNIKGDTDWAAQGDGTYQGFKAAAGAEAYVNLGGTTTVAGHKLSLEISEGVILAHGMIVDLGKDNSGVQPTYSFSKGIEVADQKVTFTLSDSKCGFTWTKGEGQADPIEPEVYTYAFEDSDEGDYDMNDVVLRVNEKAGDATKLVVTLVATGADYNIETYINDQILSFNGETEVHRALLGEAGERKHINTESTAGDRKTSADFVTCEIDKPADFNNDFSSLKVSIKVLNTGKTYTYPNTNAYPNAIMVPNKWKWPKEQVCVTTAYSDGHGTEADHSFATWASEYPHIKALDWYDYPINGQVCDK